MIWLSFKRWSNAAGSLFVVERIYWRGSRWTPFVLLSWRYVGLRAEMRRRWIEEDAP